MTSPPLMTSSPAEGLCVPAAELFDTTSTVSRVLAAFPRWILKTRTPFSKFLAQTFCLHPGEPSPDSVVFPLPLADFGIFKSSGPQLSKRRWLRLLRKRLLHVVIVALNFVYGGAASVDVDLLRRRPNAVQRAAHLRLWALLTTCDTPGHCFSLVPGRSGPEFIARLKELEDFAMQSNLLHIDSYGGGPRDFENYQIGEVQSDPSSLPVQPYTSLKASRLRLVGTGSWDLASHLHDELWLPFVEPKILHHGGRPDFSQGPDFTREEKEENLRLAMLWSTKGLLTLVSEPPHLGSFSRVFNAYKNKEADRQIGDRRLANSVERSIRGPSQFLPGGYLMCNIHVPPGFKAMGFITDRKDFYHQASVTLARAQSNVLPFSYDLKTFKGTLAYDDFLQRRHGRRQREFVGDGSGKRNHPSILVDEPKVFPAFRSLFQGDHLGVEFALSAHASLLEDAGLLKPERRVLGKRPFPISRVYEGLVIDDYFAVSVDKLSARQEVSPGEVAIDAALAAYEKEDVLGSPEKDVRGSSHFKVIGAEVNSSQQARSRSLTTVAAPAEKRLALAVLSMRVACLPVISSSLASRLAGNWTSVLMYRRCLTCLISKLYAFGTSKQKGEIAGVFHFSRSAAEELVLASV